MPEKAKNILLFMTDQLNPDYLSCTPAHKCNTPNIDRIAAGIRFENAVTTNPVCLPARCSLLTGKFPHQVGTMTMSGGLNPDYPTYPQALQKLGYHTSAVGKLHLIQGWHWDAPVGMGHDLVALKEETKRYGFDEVWEAAGKGLMLKNDCDYARYLREKGLLEAYRSELIRRENPGHPEYPNPSESFGISESDHVEHVITDEVIRQIHGRNPRQPFLIFCSYLSPHPMIDPPKRYLDGEPLREDEEFLLRPGQEELSEEMKARWRQNRRGYRALVRFVDDQIGRILTVLEEEGILDDTIVLFTADHGDVLGNFRVDGKNLPWRESSTVPLAIRHPDFLTGKVISAPVSLIDVTATILDIAGADPQNSLSLFWPAWNHVVPCRSLMPILRGETDSVREFTFTENDSFEMIQTLRYKYIRWRTVSPEYTPCLEELYDLSTDPLEQIDVSRNPGYASALEWCRERRDYTLNSTPAGQMGWAPVRDPVYARMVKRIPPEIPV